MSTTPASPVIDRRAVLPVHIFICVPARAKLAHWIPEVTDGPGHVHSKRTFHMPLGSDSFENSFQLERTTLENCLGCLNFTRKMAQWVRTLFVSGLPLDIKPRELYLLFRPFKGYEGSLIKLTSKQPVGFVSFDSRSEAEAAKNALNIILLILID
ncbi:RNA-binding protein with multiple splicing-like protein [Cricetulus griseus]|nr:RNA-binding protein with multiple splicing-like protein [Cricetulus griseus]